MRGQPIAANDDGLALANAVNPTRLPRDLPDCPHFRAIGRGGFDDGHGEAFAVKCGEVGVIGGGFVSPVIGDRTERMILARGQPVVGHSERADGRAVDEMFDVPKCPDAAEGVLAIETDHINGVIELVRLHQ